MRYFLKLNMSGNVINPNSICNYIPVTMVTHHCLYVVQIVLLLSLSFIVTLYSSVHLSFLQTSQHVLCNSLGLSFIGIKLNHKFSCIL